MSGGGGVYLFRVYVFRFRASGLGIWDLGFRGAFQLWGSSLRFFAGQTSGP